MKKASLFCLLLTLASLAAAVEFTRIEDVVYARKFGTALTLDVFQPEKQNGCGIIFMVSGGFFSSHEAINPALYQPFLERGYTVFAVVDRKSTRLNSSHVSESRMPSY